MGDIVYINKHIKLKNEKSENIIIFYRNKCIRCGVVWQSLFESCVGDETCFTCVIKDVSDG